MQHLLDALRPFWPLILALVVWPIVGAALSWWLWWDTPAHWDAYAAAHPGRAFLIRALRTVSPHLRKLVVAWRDYAAARSSLPPLSVLAEKQGALDASETRPPGVAHPAQMFAPAFDPSGCKPSIEAYWVPPGAFLVLCSDGVWGQVGDDDFKRAVVASGSSPAALVRALIDEALATGAPDNATAVVGYFKAPAPRRDGSIGVRYGAPPRPDADD